jgi:hypothetical protein
MCCKDVWSKWFSSSENGEDEFYEVEEALFSTIVLSNIELVERPKLRACYALLKGIYKHDVASERSVCKRQKAGNIFCQSKKVAYEKNTSLPIRSIDALGTMLDGEPYAELMITDQEYILEPLVNIDIKIDI